MPTVTKKVIIYTNADEEPVQIIKDVLDSNGFENQYLLQSFGTSELSGKLWAEGTDIEADLVTMRVRSIWMVSKKMNQHSKNWH